MSKFSFSVNYQHQIGNVFFGEDHSESDLWIAAEVNHNTSSVDYQLVDHNGATVFSRNVPNTSDWKAQALEDIKAAALERNARAEIVLDELDPEDN